MVLHTEVINFCTRYVKLTYGLQYIMYHIVDNIYLSNLLDAQDATQIKDNDIRAVCRLSENTNTSIYGPEILFVNFEIEDSFRYKEEIIDIARMIVTKIVLPLQDQEMNVLIHCNEGKSRSVSVIVYYLIKHKGYTFDDALSLIKSIKHDVKPNKAFEEELRKL